MKYSSFIKRRSRSLSLGLGILVASAGACKDDEPCDPNEQSVGTGCFRVATGGSAGSSNVAEAGAGNDAGQAGGTGEPVGNPDATFGTRCESDADCGGDAPICDFKMFHYCLQTACSAGEANEGVCPESSICVPEGEDAMGVPYPSACIDPSGL